jgi:EmrB/QacA subfamily drug resistance transporter
MSQAAPDPRRWQALALVCVAFFMTILDVSIVNVALPSIGDALKFSEQSLQWVVTAYAITFGGFLLLGGRSADYLGRRRVFMVGLALFTLASLVCGLAQSEGMLIAARAVQGLGAAIISPATLSIITTTFREGAERNKALGIWGAMGGSGAAVGVLAGGVLTKYLGWEWIFFVNVPVGALVLALTVPIVRESRVDVAQRRYDPLGAVTVTGGLALLVFAISKAPDWGWGSGRAVGLLVVSGALLAAFVVIEAVGKAPLMPLRIFRLRTLAGANVVGALLSVAVYSNFFVLTLYVQNVLHWSALKAGVTFVATAGTVVVVAGLAQALVTRFGPKWVMTTGLALICGSMLWYAQIPVNGSYATDLLPGYLMMGFGLAFAFIPVSVAALAGVEAREAGLASGILNTSQQIGGAIGVAVASTIASTHATTLLKQGTAAPEALTSGFRWAFWFLAGIAVAGVVASITLIRREEVAPEAEAIQVPV